MFATEADDRMELVTLIILCLDENILTLRKVSVFFPLRTCVQLECSFVV